MLELVKSNYEMQAKQQFDGLSDQDCWGDKAPAYSIIKPEKGTDVS